jgi:antitoxin VapB
MLNLPRETEQLARLVALKSGKAPEDVVRQAIEDHAAARGLLPPRARKPIDMNTVNAIIERYARRPVLDPRAPEEIIGHDEFGIPKRLWSIHPP